MAASEDLEMAVEQETGPGASGRYPQHITSQEKCFIGTYDHQISQIIFKGEKNTYVYDTTEVRLHMET